MTLLRALKAIADEVEGIGRKSRSNCCRNSCATSVDWGMPMAWFCRSDLRRGWRLPPDVCART